jgi:GMP synthase-like glutamine amidotransferase
MPVCLVVQHVEPEGPFAFGTALERAGGIVERCRVFDGERVPDDAEGLDGLVVMGGPASATSDDAFPSRRSELALLTDALDRRIPVLGVCLGAQLLALAAGGSVRAGAAGAEIGWAPVDLAAASGADPLLAGAEPRPTVLHWHLDTFDLPPGATHLASSARYPNQAFRVGERAWGLQFHLEVDRPAVEGFLAAFGDDARAAGADPDAIWESTDSAIESLAVTRDLVAGRFAGLVVGQRHDPELVRRS